MIKKINYIAEIGVNHLGKTKLADNFVKKLINTQVDAITFQILTNNKISKLQIKNLPKIFYSQKIREIKKSNKNVGIAISDESFIDFFNEQKIDFWKVLSIDFYNQDLIKKLKKTNKPIYLSTGFSSTKEINNIKKISSKIKFIHTNLSHNIDDTNLFAISTLQKKTKRNVAFGLHCDNHKVLYAAVAFKPESIFFYVKNPKYKIIFDNKHAIELSKIDIILKNLDNINKSLGNGQKIKYSTNNPEEKIK